MALRAIKVLLASSIAFLASSVTLAQLAPRATWSSLVDRRTDAIAWGDWDGDGDPDLVVGNCFLPQKLQVYRNDAGILAFAWSPDEADCVTSVQWGDWDGDGDLDLLAGTAYAGVEFRVYENDGGAPPTMRLVWSGPAPASANDAAWADWDGDGDLDVVVANGDLRFYRNDGGSYSFVRSEAHGFAQTVAWGDYDRDGDMDIAVGTIVGAFMPYTVDVYANDGAASPRLILVWSSAEEENTYSVAWGDWDGDGDLDLAVANYTSTRIYRNDGGSFTLAWTADESDYATDVAWGDWDGDGDLDLAVAVWGLAPNRVYENSGSASPMMTLAWASEEPDYSTCLAWADVDGDGDLDLAVGNLGDVPGGRNRLYTNTTGCLAELSPVTELLAVKPSVGIGVVFSWRADPAAIEHHVNSVADKAELLLPGPYRVPVPGAVGEPACDVYAPAATCPDVDASADPILHYQVFSACGPGGAQEGPAFYGRSRRLRERVVETVQ